jgi:hypothetical protein
MIHCPHQQVWNFAANDAREWRIPGTCIFLTWRGTDSMKDNFRFRWKAIRGKFSFYV